MSTDIRIFVFIVLVPLVVFVPLQFRLSKMPGFSLHFLFN